MDVYQVIDVIKKLAHSQGFYGRLLEEILYAQVYEPETFYKFKEVIEDQHFKDPLDVVLYFEC